MLLQKQKNKSCSCGPGHLVFYSILYSNIDLFTLILIVLCFLSSLQMIDADGIDLFALLTAFRELLT